MVILRYVKHLALLLCIVLLAACNKGVDFIPLSPETTLSVLPDSSFLGSCRGFQYVDGELYVLDIDRRSVLVFDEELSTYSSIANGGNGPGELLAPFSFFASEDSVYIMDFGSFSMKVFSDGHFIRSRSFPFQVWDSRFVIDSSLCIFPFKNQEYNVVKMDMTGDDISPLSEVDRFPTPMKTVTMNRVSVLRYRDGYLVLPSSLAWVKILDGEGAELRSFNLCSNKVYSINEQYSHKAYSEQKSAYTLNGDGYIKDDTLYLLIPEYGDHFKKNRIMMLDLQSGEILPTVLVLKGSSYSSFCVGNNHLFCFNDDYSQIERYAL